MNLICPLCKGEPLTPALSDVRDLEYGMDGKFNFYGCPACNLLVLLPLPSLEDLKNAYPDDYHGFHTSETRVISYLYRLLYFFRLGEYKQLIGEKGNLLDIGCADAYYFDLLKQRFPKINPYGIELKDEIAEKGRKKGRNITTGTIDNFVSGIKFDLIIMNNLIEHVLDPVKELERAKSFLKPEGYIVIETPNKDSWDYILMKKFWGGLHAPRHTYIFSTSSLNDLVSKSGFKLVKTNFLLNTDHWALSIQNFLQSTMVFCANLENGRAWYYKYLLFLFLPLNILQFLFRKTGSIKMVIKKHETSGS
ncbi:MAG: class I SAM-dependent methyltransferase [Candidatus Omnitrophica bacterium]|nr:class I SAM-dependent methyltransferase [Candidatus Omnitrophota bacterium]